MGTYVTATGFVARTLQQILSSFNAAMVSFFGPTIDTSAEGPTGQLLGLEAAGLGDAWNGIQEVYASMDPAQASGAALDRICAYTGVVRIAAAQSTVYANLYALPANDGVTIPSGSTARRVRGAVVFSLTTNAVISSGSCQDLYLSFGTVPAIGATVTLVTSFGSFSVTATSDAVATTRAINTMSLLAAAINAGTWGTPTPPTLPGVAQVWSGGVLQYPATDAVGGEQFPTGVVLRLQHQMTPFSYSSANPSNSQWATDLIGSQGSFICSVTGAQTVAVNELTAIVSPQTGWAFVTNIVPGVPGRDVETDDALRLRRAQQLGLGLSTPAAMTAYIFDNVAGVSTVNVASNDTDLTVSGAPPHTVTATVVGGDPLAIATAVWASKPAGIGTSGNTTRSVTDSQGTAHNVSFNIPTATNILVKVTYNTYSEETFPGTAAITTAILAWAATEFSAGKDVIAPRFLGPIYTVPGLGDVVVTISTDGTTYVATPIVIGAGNVAEIPSATNITYVFNPAL
jgi:uncharacterized phage protein gp47/JayE